MKKLLAVLLTALLTLSLAAASAESVRFVEDSPKFDIEMELPEGATVASKSGSDLVSVTDIAKEGLATVHITIAASDLYDEKSLADLSEEEVDALKALSASEYENPQITIETTPSGNQYIYVCSGDEYDVDNIFTLYKGYFVELTQWNDDYSKITDEEHAFMLQLLHNIQFIELDAAK